MPRTLSKPTTTMSHGTLPQGMAKNNRDYSETEQAEQAYSKSEVVLAFPLAQNSAPILEKQYIHAFLPVRKEGFDVSIIRPML